MCIRDRDQIVTITPESIDIIGFDGAPAQGKPYEVTWDAAAAEKGGHRSFCLLYTSRCV